MRTIQDIAAILSSKNVNVSDFYDEECFLKGEELIKNQKEQLQSILDKQEHESH